MSGTSLLSILISDNVFVRQNPLVRAAEISDKVKFNYYYRNYRVNALLALIALSQLNALFYTLSVSLRPDLQMAVINNSIKSYGGRGGQGLQEWTDRMVQFVYLNRSKIFSHCLNVRTVARTSLSRH